MNSTQHSVRATTTAAAETTATTNSSPPHNIAPRPAPSTARETDTTDINGARHHYRPTGLTFNIDN
jgi:hypothetical protein